MIIDTHCHFDMMPSPEDYINRMEREGNIVIGMTNLPSHFQIGIPHIQKYRHIRLALGFHPLLADRQRQELPLFKSLLERTSYIGEIGLDFSKEGCKTKEVQLLLLREVFSILKGKNKIISVHSRRAEKELLLTLEEFDIKNVVFHWYSGPVALIPKILDRGYYFSINEAMTLSQNGKRIIEMIPHNRILTETDAPFNEKVSINRVLEYTGLSEAEITNNFKSLLKRIAL